MLFTCFIDFKKAFDTVPHDKLLLKLRQCGIQGKFQDIIVYSKIKLHISVKVNNNLTESFPAQQGVRQGDVLSPNIFNIFVNSLYDYLDDLCCSLTITERL
jgi:retron-type reverse transcriptase